jgi:hypothetical protein
MRQPTRNDVLASLFEGSHSAEHLDRLQSSTKVRIGEGQELCRSRIETDERQVAVDDENRKLNAIDEFHLGRA